MPSDLVLDKLRRRLRGDGSAPLLTYYDPAQGQRTELSVRSFANWVDKTSNLFADFDVAGGVVAGGLSRTHPGHWLSLILPLAAWQAGATYRPAADPDAAVAIVGPDAPRAIVPGATLACSLHPFALPLTPLPAGVLDFNSEALAEPDQPWHPVPPRADGEAWNEDGRRLTHAEVAATPAVAGRRLVRATTPWETVAAGIVAPLLGGGSTVLLVGEVDDAQEARIRAAERCVE